MRRKIQARLLCGVVAAATIVSLVQVYYVLNKQVIRDESDVRVLNNREHLLQPPQRLSEGTLTNDMAIRAARMREVCKGREVELFGLTDIEETYTNIEVSRKRNFMYCPILKVGSTFFRRALYAILAKGNLTDPYKIPIDLALRAKRNLLIDIYQTNENEFHEMVAGSNSFMFVREPFTRLLSGYMDKLFAPNPYFWRVVGQHIVSKFRPGAAKKDLDCGHNVTFREFVAYVVDGEMNAAGDESLLEHRDAHFSPAYDWCKVCAMNYTHLGKMETFSSDAAVVFRDVLGVDVTNESLSKWSQEATRDAILDSVHSPFGWKSHVTPCMTWYEGLRRVWRKLQSRAIIPLEDDFPFTKKKSETSLTAQQFIAAAVSSNANADKERLQRQKKEVLALAFRELEPDLLGKYLQTFHADFELFDYDNRPDHIFDLDFVARFRDRPSLFDVSLDL